jgi:predicted HicB family RNase H-like nuclease
VTTALRLPKEVHERLKSAADERGVGVNYLAVRALEEFLAHLVPVDELVLTRR